MKNKRLLTVAAFFGLLGLGGAITNRVVFADQFQDQINALSNENSSKQGNLSQLGSEASNFQDAINKLQVQVSGLQSQITNSEVKRDDTIAKIAQAEAELVKQRSYLSDNIKAMYVDGDISSLEMLASSQDINHFVDQEQYQNSVQGQIQKTLDSIKQLRTQLDTDKANLEKMIADLNGMRTQLVSQQAEQARLLSLNQQQQNELDSQIKNNRDKILDLQRQQSLLNSPGGVKIPPGIPGGGGYPGAWANPPRDTLLDSWGMYNRECVSWTAYKVWASGRYMPAWGSRGIGDAKQWDDNARAEGIPVDSKPRKGDVAVSNAGTWGHVMYVESVAADGSIYVSDYNQQYDGLYREYWLPAATVASKGLVFIHF